MRVHMHRHLHLHSHGQMHVSVHMYVSVHRHVSVNHAHAHAHARAHARAQVAHNIGIVRVALFVLVPALLSLLVMMMCALQPLTTPYRPLPPLAASSILHRQPATSTRTAPAATRRARQQGRRERWLLAW